MGKCVFKLDDVKAVLASAQSERIAFVHDDGIYLIASKRAEGDKTIAYAKGCTPEDKAKSFDTWWDKQRSLVGGDDFAEYLTKADFQALIDQGVTEIVITVSATRMTLGGMLPPAPPKTKGLVYTTDTKANYDTLVVGKSMVVPLKRGRRYIKKVATVTKLSGLVKGKWTFEVDLV
jgi:hypothetical protein